MRLLILLPLSASIALGSSPAWAATAATPTLDGAPWLVWAALAAALICSVKAIGARSRRPAKSFDDMESDSGPVLAPWWVAAALCALLGAGLSAASEPGQKWGEGSAYSGLPGGGPAEVCAEWLRPLKRGCQAIKAK